MRFQRKHWWWRKMAIEDRLHEARFWIFWKLIFLSFKKFWTKILDVEYNLFYNPAKFQHERVCISAYIKITNSDKSEKSENFRILYFHSLRSRNLSFSHSLKYEIFRIDFLHAARSHYCPHLRNFFKTLKCWFLLNSKNRLHDARPLYRRTVHITYLRCISVITMFSKLFILYTTHSNFLQTENY
jgi:hypothetical protein